MVYRIKINKNTNDTFVQNLLLPTMLFEIFCGDHRWYGEWYTTKHNYIYYSNYAFDMTRLDNLLVELKQKKIQQLNSK